MAAPVVSGAVALMLQKSPSLHPDQVKARLMKTASKTFPAYTSYTDPTMGITYTSRYCGEKKEGGIGLESLRGQRYGLPSAQKQALDRVDPVRTELVQVLALLRHDCT